MVDEEKGGGIPALAEIPAVSVEAVADPLHPAPLTGPTTRQIGLTEPVGAGLQRICLDRLDRAIAGLTLTEGRDGGIHTARKALKRIRAMIRFVRDVVGYPVYRNENVVLRDTARRVAPVRDSAVLVETLNTVVDRHGGGLADGAFGEPRARLEERHRRVSDRILDDRQLMCEVVTTLRVSRARFASWPMEETAATVLRRPLPEQYETIAGGIHRVYRRGKKRMHDAMETRTTFAFHQWRKRVKYLRYQMEALESIWPEGIGGYARSLDALGESLGLEHDLAMLEHAISTDPVLCPDPEERRLLGAMILHERAVLRHGARRAGMVVYAEDPDAFVARLGAYWEAARLP